MISRPIVVLVVVVCTWVHLVAAGSLSRGHLRALSILQNTRILTASGRVDALSEFDTSFELDDGYRVQHFRLRLEPSHDILPDGATVTYLDSAGRAERSHPIVRSEHKIFKGSAFVQEENGAWKKVGWARITVVRDGVRPLLEGAFTVLHDSHHVQLRSSYIRTRHQLDPYAEATDDEYMILFRDSCVNKNLLSQQEKREVGNELTCRSEELHFNTQFNTPVYTGMIKRDDTFWEALPLGSIFGKRQIDSQGGGNSAGVNLASTIGSTAGCPTTRKVALVGVATDCGYTASFNSTEVARQSVITAMNSASSVWESAFNISLGLQNLTISTADCPGTPQAATLWNQGCSSDLDITSRLNLFSAWRGTLEDTNSHWTLLTSCPTGSEVGLAWLGQACVHTASTSNATDGTSETSSGTNVVALTSTEWQVIAHETGHTFGAVHDCTSTTCTDGTTVASQQCCPLSTTTCDAGQAYIMNPSTGSGISNFSACTIGNICTALGRNSVNTTCLSANKGVVTITGQQCGNGIVEEGEECDCGGTSGCGDNACCDPTTCMFQTGAVCDDSNEDCCVSCQFAVNGTTCRASTGFCDPAETCGGTDAICPTNDPSALDGEPCTSSNSTSTSLTCASGQCTSRDLQCETVMADYVFTTSSGTALTVDANNTYACSSRSCSVSCTSPAFGPGICYGLQQNFLDGTPCDAGGACSNGVCKGASVPGEIRSWIDDHRPLVIGLAAGLGGLLLLIFANCVIGCCRRSSRRRKAAAAKGYVGHAPDRSWYGPPSAPHPPAPMQEQQHEWRPTPPLHTVQPGLYGSGILGRPSQSQAGPWQLPQLNADGWEMNNLETQGPPPSQDRGRWQKAYPAPPPSYPAALRSGISAVAQAPYV